MEAGSHPFDYCIHSDGHIIGNFLELKLLSDLLMIIKSTHWNLQFIMLADIAPPLN